MLDTDPIPGSLRYRVLKESDGRCSLCGRRKKKGPNLRGGVRGVIPVKMGYY